MAFVDPTPVTIGGASKNLVRIDTGRFQSEYRLVEATQDFKLLVRNAELKIEADGRRKVRHNLSLMQTVFPTATTPILTRLGSLVWEHYIGDDLTQADDVALAVAALASAANLAKLGNFES